jgi:hypothetical protein
MHTNHKSSDPVATIGLDIGKNTFHLVGLDKRGARRARLDPFLPAVLDEEYNLTSKACDSSR